MTNHLGESGRLLLLMRHAKSEHTWGVDDVDRALLPRGHRDAAVAGVELSERFPDGVDLVLVSPAIRTRQTWEGVHKSFAAREVRYERGLYHAGRDSVSRLVQELDESARTVLVIGHGPTIPETALSLTSDARTATVTSGTDADAWHRLAAKCPTSGIALVAVECGWADIGPGQGRLIEFLVPRG